MKLPEKIAKSDASLSTKIVQLFAVVMLNYRQPLGDAAWTEMAKLAGPDTVQALAFLTGMLMGQNGSPNPDRWQKLLPTSKRKKK